jgi:aspartate/methionine/tyrosine aminotransferase
MGSKEGILHIMMAFVNEGDEVLIPDPGYPTYESAARLVGASIKTYPLQEDQNWFVDIDKLRKQDLSKVKVMWVNFPNMPTGRVASTDEMRALVELAVEHNFLIVNDNPYSFIMNDNPLSILSVNGAEHVALELNSLSKSHNMAGWRIGWVAGHATYIDAVLRVKSNMDSGMFLGLQTAAVEALAHDNAWFEKLNATYRERKKIGEEILAALNCTFQADQSGLFVWAKVPDQVTSVKTWVDDILYKTHVFITPGFIFGKGGDRFVRLSVCASADKLTEALERIRKFSATSKAGKQKSVTV